MALLDQELETDNVEAGERDNATSAAEMCAEKLPVNLILFSLYLAEWLVSCSYQELCFDGRQNKRRRVGMYCSC